MHLMTWTVEFTAKAAKQVRELPVRIAERVDALRKSIQASGPAQPTMPHFGKLKGLGEAVYHCHLNKGRPVYVAIWNAVKKTKTVVMSYVGTHEDAPY